MQNENKIHDLVKQYGIEEFAFCLRSQSFNWKCWIMHKPTGKLVETEHHTPLIAVKRADRLMQAYLLTLEEVDRV